MSCSYLFWFNSSGTFFYMSLYRFIDPFNFKWPLNLKDLDIWKQSFLYYLNGIYLLTPSLFLYFVWQRHQKIDLKFFCIRKCPQCDPIFRIRIRCIWTFSTKRIDIFVELTWNLAYSFLFNNYLFKCPTQPKVVTKQLLGC